MGESELKVVLRSSKALLSRSTHAVEALVCRWLNHKRGVLEGNLSSKSQFAANGFLKARDRFRFIFFGRLRAHATLRQHS